MPESLRTRLARWWFNWFPAYRGTGGQITYIAADWSEVRLRLPLNRRTRNYVGTIFGGSMYGAVDPIYMVMLIQVLGPAYVVWDKSLPPSGSGAPVAKPCTRRSGFRRKNWPRFARKSIGPASSRGNSPSIW